MPSPVAYKRAGTACDLARLTDDRERGDDGRRDACRDHERRQRAHDERADIRAGLLLIADVGELGLQRARQLQRVCAEHREARARRIAVSSGVMIHGCWKNACGACLNASTNAAPAAA